MMAGCGFGSERLPAGLGLEPLLKLLQEQAHRIGRLEEIVAAAPDPPSPAGAADTAPSAAAAATALRAARDEERWAEELERAEARMRGQVADLRDAVAALETRQAAAATQEKQRLATAASTAGRLASLEARLLGGSGAGDASGDEGGGWRVPPLGAERAGQEASGGGVMERLARLEEAVARTAEALEERTGFSGKLRRLEARVTEQLSNARDDAARSVAAAAAAASRDADAALAERLAALEERTARRTDAAHAELEARLARAAACRAGEASSELERRVGGAFESLDARLRELQSQLDALARSKADAASLGACAEQLSDAFEEAAASLSRSGAAAHEDLSAQLSELRATLADLSTARAADAASARRLQSQVAGGAARAEELEARTDALERGAGAAAKAADVERQGLELSELRGSLQALQATTHGLHAAVSSASGTLERHGRAIDSLAARCSAAARRADELRSEVFGGGDAAAAGHPDGGDPGPGGATPLAARVERAEAAWRGAAVRLEQKADCAEVRDAAARLDELQEQVGANSERVRALTSTTYKRVDEHAGAIQRLAEAINSSNEDRPTRGAVQRWISEGLAEAEAAHESVIKALKEEQKEAEARLLQEASKRAQAATARAEGAWERTEQLQSASAAERARADDALRQLKGRLEAVASQVAQSGRSLGAGARAELADAVKQQLEDRLKLLGADELPRRLSAAETRLRAVAVQQSAAGKEAIAQGKLLEKHANALAALEDAVAKGAAACTAASGKLSARADAARRAAAEKQAAVAAEVQRQGAALSALRAGLGLTESGGSGGGAGGTGGSSDGEAVRAAVAAAAARAAEQHSRQRAREDEARWKACLDGIASALEARVTRDELGERDRAASAAAQSAAARAAGKAVDAFAARLGPVEERLDRLELEAEVGAAAAAEAARAAARDAAAAARALACKADADAVERVEVRVQELGEALGAKLDVSTFVAASAARARALEAHSAAVLVAGGGGGGGGGGKRRPAG